MLRVTAPADELGISVLAAGARTAAAALGGEGEGVGLVVRQLAADARIRLRGGEETEPISITADVRGTEFVVCLHDLGSPVVGPPDSVQALLEAGVATAAEARTDGKGNLTEVRFALPSHHRVLDAAQLDVVPEDAEPVSEEVTIRRLEPADAPALTRAIYRCYGWSYPNPALYYPERIAAALANGSRIGEIAVTASGEVASHWGAVFLSPNVVETGGTITDPRFRRRGLAKALGDRLLERLEDMQVTGRLRLPVITHPATQQIALDEGATMVGAYVHLAPQIKQIGITEGSRNRRASVTVAYSALQPLESATMWVPAPYEPIVRKILDSSDWPRTIGSPRRDHVIPASSALSSSFNFDTLSGSIDVATVGQDIVTEVQTALGQMRRSGAEYVQVLLPLDQQATASVASGLIELGLGYAALVPAFRSNQPSGDVLELQWLADTQVDTSDWVFATNSVRDLVSDVIDQATLAAGRTTTRERRAAQRAQLFAALPD